MPHGVPLLIPAYQPAEPLVALVEGVLAADHAGIVSQILIVDDGSDHACDPVFLAVSRLPRVTVIHHVVNLGKGAALKTGFNYALTSWPESMGIVTADADGQHAAEDILAVAGALAARPAVPVFGVRKFGTAVPLRSLIGNRVTRIVLRQLTGVRVTDTQTGLRGWPRRMCVESLHIPLNGYEFELESLIRGAQDAHEICEIPIRTVYVDGNRSSHFNPLRDSMRIYYVFLRYCASSIAVAFTDYLVFLLVLSTHGNVGLSQFSARATALLLSFFLVRTVVFRSRSEWWWPFVKFVCLVAANGLISYAMIQFLHSRFGVPVLLAKMTAEGLLYLGSFAIQREFVFSRKSVSEPA